MMQFGEATEKIPYVVAMAMNRFMVVQEMMIFGGTYGDDSLYGKNGADELYGGWGPNNGTIDNNDTCYDTAGTFTMGCEVFYEQ